MAPGLADSFVFQAPPASEDTKAAGLLAGMGSGGLMDTQKAMFLQQVIEKEDEVYGVQQKTDLEKELGEGLTDYQKSLLERVRRANTDPVIKYARAATDERY